MLELPLVRCHLARQQAAQADTIPERRQDPGRRYGTKTSLCRVYWGLLVDTTNDCDGMHSSHSESTR
jgi:hypothetical protein